MSKVAIVTGANKGLGLATVKGLSKKFDGTVYLTSRDTKRGLEALKNLSEYGNVKYHQLDVNDETSIKDFRDFLERGNVKIEILVNNAAILEWQEVYPSFEAAKRNIDINYRSLLSIEKYLFPLLIDGAKVINVSSACGHLSNLRKQRWIEMFKSKDLNEEQINLFVNEYLASVKNGTFNKDDFADDGKHAEYRVSKIALTALTMVWQKKYPNMSINAVHPGHVKTDMANGGGDCSPEEAAKSILYLAFEASINLKGVFLWSDRKLIDWYDADGDYCRKGLW